RIRRYFPYALVVLHHSPHVVNDSAAPRAGETRSPRDIMVDFFREVGGREMNTDEYDVLDRAWTTLNAEVRP
ncbi:MAG: exonuclease SbcCD subunit D, partial [Actinobacteria bacterium]